MLLSTPSPVISSASTRGPPYTSSVSPKEKITSTTQQITSIVKSDARVLPSASMPRSFSAHNTSDIANASTHFSGDAKYKIDHPNALCVTSVATSNLNELCTLAFEQNQNGDSVCAWRGNYVVSIDDENIPAGGIKECGKTKNSDEICVPKGTVAFPCGVTTGVNVGGGNYSMTPTFIAIPKSQADLLLNGYGNCYSANPHNADKKYGYVKTSNFSVAYSNPYQAGI